MRTEDVRGKEPARLAASARPIQRSWAGKASWPRRPVAVAVVAALLVALAGSGLASYLAKLRIDELQVALASDMEQGSRYLSQGKDAVKRANSSNDPAPLVEATADFDRARSIFRAAQRKVHADGLVSYAGWIPVLGSAVVTPRLRAVDGLTEMGIALADAGRDAAELDNQLLRPTGDRDGGPRMVATLKATAPFLGRIKAQLERARAAAAQVDPGLLLDQQRKTFATAVEQISSGVAGLQEYERLAPVLLDVLGASGPRTFLVEQIDPAELRGGGGFIGSYSLLKTDNGAISLEPGQDIYALDYPYPQEGQARFVAPPPPIRQAFNHGFVLGDSNFWPDFPTAARAGIDLLKREAGTNVDGVLSIDPWAVAALLQLTGPIAIPEYGTVVRPETFAEDVFQRLETEAANVPGKKAFFPAVAARVIEKVSSLPSENWSKLLDTLNGVVRQRHLQVYLVKAEAQAELSRVGWSGEIARPSANQEVMLEAESNFGATKSNHFLDRSYHLTLTAEGGKLRHRVVIDLKNFTPDGYLGGRTYNYYLRLYVPADATEIGVRGLVPSRFPNDEKPPGLRVIDGWGWIEIRDLRPGAYATQQVVLEYTTSWAKTEAARSIYWQKQAGTLSDKTTVDFVIEGKSYTVSSDLGTDRLLVLGRDGIQVKEGSQGSAKLPTVI